MFATFYSRLKTTGIILILLVVVSGCSTNATIAYKKLSDFSPKCRQYNTTIFCNYNQNYDTDKYILKLENKLIVGSEYRMENKLKILWNNIIKTVHDGYINFEKESEISDLSKNGRFAIVAKIERRHNNNKLTTFNVPISSGAKALNSWHNYLRKNKNFISDYLYIAQGFELYIKAIRKKFTNGSRKVYVSTNKGSSPSVDKLGNLYLPSNLSNDYPKEELILVMIHEAIHLYFGLSNVYKDRYLNSYGSKKFISKNFKSMLEMPKHQINLDLFRRSQSFFASKHETFIDAIVLDATRNKISNCYSYLNILKKNNLHSSQKMRISFVSKACELIKTKEYSYRKLMSISQTINLKKWTKSYQCINNLDYKKLGKNVNFKKFKNCLEPLLYKSNTLWSNSSKNQIELYLLFLYSVVTENTSQINQFINLDIPFNQKVFNIK